MLARSCALFLAFQLLEVSSIAAVSFQMAHVANRGNPDFSAVLYPFGGVDYGYKISKAEVTGSQYLEFLNAVDPEGANSLGLYNGPLLFTNNRITFDPGKPAGAKYEFLGPGYEQLAAALPSWFSAVRFANWMHNGQGDGDTESGSYTLLGNTPVPQAAANVKRNSRATWVVPSIDEWFKAAFHKNDGPTEHYWTYATSRDTFPYSAQPPGYGAPDKANTGNVYADDGIPNGYNNGYARTGTTAYFPGQVTGTDVGAYQFSVSPYGTWDQFGNVSEWTDTLTHIDDTRWVGPLSRFQNDYAGMNAQGIGFRLALVPEPTVSCYLAAITAWSLLLRRTRS